MPAFLALGDAYNSRAKNVRSHGRQWRVKTDQGHQELTVNARCATMLQNFEKLQYKKYELQS